PACAPSACMAARKAWASVLVAGSMARRPTTLPPSFRSRALKAVASPCPYDSRSEITAARATWRLVKAKSAAAAPCRSSVTVRRKKLFVCPGRRSDAEGSPAARQLIGVPAGLSGAGTKTSRVRQGFPVAGGTMANAAGVAARLSRPESGRSTPIRSTLPAGAGDEDVQVAATTKRHAHIAPVNLVLRILSIPFRALARHGSTPD